MRHLKPRCTDNELLDWLERWLEAELTLCEKREDRIAALKAHVDRAWQIERIAAEMARDLIPLSDVSAVSYERIGAEIRYFQATGEIPPPPPKPQELQPPQEKP